MSYEVTATRKRPRTFDQLVGQEFVVSTLKNSLKSGRIAHAYLFAGPRGVGKTSAARILATALNCPDGPDPEACPDYSGSDEIHRGTALDVIEIDGASNTSVNDVRAIKDEVLFAPNSSRYKIYIIDEVHMLSNSAFNALLKTIEEPPAYIVFIFATTEIHKVPATIRSRCQQFNFRLIPLDTIADLLVQAAEEMGLKADQDAVMWIAKESTGSLRDAYTLFDQVAAFSDEHVQLETIHEKLGLFGLERLNSLAENLAAGDAHEALTLVQEGVQSGVSVERMAQELADYYRSLLLIANGIERAAVLGMSPDRFPDTVRQAYTISQLERANELLLRLYRDLRYTVDQRFELELVISRLADLQQFVYPEELIQRVDQVRQKLADNADSVGAGSAVSLNPAYTRPAGHTSNSGTQSADGSDPSLEDAPPASVEAPAAPDVPPPDDTPSSDATTQEAPVGEVQPTASSQRAEADPSSPTSVDAAGAAEAATPSGAGQSATTEVSADDDGADSDLHSIHVNGFSYQQIRTVIDRFRTKRIGVSSILQNATGWDYDGTVAHISFPTDYLANHASEEREILRDVLAEEMGNPGLRLKIQAENKNDRNDAGNSPKDEKTEMVKRVFRGEIVENEQ